MLVHAELLTRLSVGFARVPVVERQRRDTGVGEVLFVLRQQHAMGCAQAMSEHDGRMRTRAVGAAAPSAAGVDNGPALQLVLPPARQVDSVQGHRPAAHEHHELLGPLVQPDDFQLEAPRF